MMNFELDSGIFELAPDLCVGIVVAEDVNNAGPVAAIAALLEEQVGSVLKSLAGSSVNELNELQPYRDLIKAMGINPRKYPSSVEALLERLIKKGGLPQINPAVDLANCISIKYKIPVGVHDLDSLGDDLCIRLATKADCAIKENSFADDELSAGEPVYVSGNSVRTRRWIWRQTEAGRKGAGASRIVFPVDGFVDNKDTVVKACQELASLLETHLKCTARVLLADSEHPRVNIGKLSEAELVVENTIKMMLKGVAEHTPVMEIRSRLARAHAEGRPLNIKLGLDPSAPDIHLGHAVVLRKIRQMQDLGHRATIIIGDYTGKIGDPSGKSKTRKPLTDEEVMANAKTYQEQIFKIVDEKKATVRFNSEWFSKMSFAEVIALASKCTVARMLERDDFNKRYANHQPLGIHEFLYPLMQGYDSVVIASDIELGGTDQTFNILMGRNIQRDYGHEPQLTLFTPLLEGLDGVEKMSKSLGNYIGINEEPQIIYEKVMKVPDDFILKYYNLCTDAHPDSIEKIRQRLENGENPRNIKMELAWEITRLYCGEESADSAKERFVSVFQKNEVPDDIPVIELSSAAPQGEQIADRLVAMGDFKSKGEIRRVFQQGGAQIDGIKVTDLLSVSVGADAVLKLGKNRLYKIVCQK